MQLTEFLISVLTLGNISVGKKTTQTIEFSLSYCLNFTEYIALVGRIRCLHYYDHHQGTPATQYCL